MLLGVKCLDLDSAVVRGQNPDSVKASSPETPFLKHCICWMALAHLANYRARVALELNTRGSLCSRTGFYDFIRMVGYRGLYKIKLQGVTTDWPLQNRGCILWAPGSWVFGILKIPAYLSWEARQKMFFKDVRGIFALRSQSLKKQALGH